MSTQDAMAIIEASQFIQHGETMLGGSFTDCVCPKTRCGGVAGGTEHDGCPVHQRNPVQRWHWAVTCPAVLADARACMRRGLAVFPLPPGGRVPEPGWQKAATLDMNQLPKLFADGANVGVACRASRVVALDLDVHNPATNGVDSLRAQIQAHGEDWPDTFTVATPSGGRHMYFRVPADCTIGSTSGGRTALGPGIDVRGPGRHRGGYLVGPGSTVNGLSYLIAHNIPVAPLPDWIGALLTGREGGRTRFTVEGFTPTPVKERACNCVCGLYHFNSDGMCAGDATREVEVTWISVMTGKPAEPRVEPLCSPCYEAVVARLARGRGELA